MSVHFLLCFCLFGGCWELVCFKGVATQNFVVLTLWRGWRETCGSRPLPGDMRYTPGELRDSRNKLLQLERSQNTSLSQVGFWATLKSTNDNDTRMTIPDGVVSSYSVSIVRKLTEVTNRWGVGQCLDEISLFCRHILLIRFKHFFCEYRDLKVCIFTESGFTTVLNAQGRL